MQFQINPNKKATFPTHPLFTTIHLPLKSTGSMMNWKTATASAAQFPFPQKAGEHAVS